MIFLLVLSSIAGLTGCAIATAGLPENLRWQGIQCGALSFMSQEVVNVSRCGNNRFSMFADGRNCH